MKKLHHKRQMDQKATYLDYENVLIVEQCSKKCINIYQLLIMYLEQFMMYSFVYYKFFIL